VLTVLVADGNPLLRLGIRALLETDAEMAIVGEATDSAQAIALTRRHHPDVVLLDAAIPGVGSVATTAFIASLTRVVLLAPSVEPRIVIEAVAAGARGFLVHGQFDSSRLTEVIRGIADGMSYLSPPAAAALVDRCYQRRRAGSGTGSLTKREHEIMELIAGGLSNRDIAERLVIAEKTVKNHVHNIYQRLGAGGREQSVALWRSLVRNG
jgi:DNA-binding NarL/FixJ family response regulator